MTRKAKAGHRRDGHHAIEISASPKYEQDTADTVTRNWYSLWLHSAMVSVSRLEFISLLINILMTKICFSLVFDFKMKTNGVMAMLPKDEL